MLSRASAFKTSESFFFRFRVDRDAEVQMQGKSNGLFHSCSCARRREHRRRFYGFLTVRVEISRPGSLGAASCWVL